MAPGNKRLVNGTELTYFHFNSPAGPMLAVASAGRLCDLRFCEKKDLPECLAEIGELHPGASLRHDASGMKALVAGIREVVAGRQSADRVPLNLRGTAFQQKVWRRLLEVPWGRTISYTQLAKRAGNARAVRAAASACARNPIVFVVPCHRIVRKDGTLGDYFYGLDCKRRLLERERR